MNNQICIEEDKVIKISKDRMGFDKETEILKALSGSGLAPELLESSALEGEGYSLTLEKNPGAALSKFIEKAMKDPECERSRVLTSLGEALARWQADVLKTFRKRTGHWMVNEDLNPRNILVQEGEGSLKITGLDFERCRNGSPEEACAVLPAMLECLDLEGSDALADFAAGLLCTALDLDPSLLGDWVRRKKIYTLDRRRAMKSIRSSSCAILAGGKGSRMGGLDKAAIRLGNYSFLEHLLHRVQIFDRIYISGERKDCLYPTIADIIKDAGPMGALHALLNTVETEHVLLLPCDSPLIKEEALTAMYLALREEDDALVLRSEGRAYPATAIYRKRILPKLEEQMTRGNYRMMALLDQINVRWLDIEDPGQLKNVNTPEDLEELRDTISTIQ